MKKIILILFLFLSCYFIYKVTDYYHLRVVSIGDELARCVDYLNYDKVTDVNSSYVDNHYRIMDLINVLEYNKEIENEMSIHRLLKRADVLIISIGMNDIYFRLDDNTKETYAYTNELVNEIEVLFDKVNKYKYKKVIFLGYYNVFDKYNDIFTYFNYKVSKLTLSYGFDYINLDNDFLVDKYIKKNGNFELNINGYEEISKIIVEKIKNN